MNSEDISKPRVKTEYGWIEGFHYPSAEHNINASIFLGIPYATPPVGELRFKVCFFLAIFKITLHLRIVNLK